DSDETDSWGNTSDDALETVGWGGGAEESQQPDGWETQDDGWGSGADSGESWAATSANDPWAPESTADAGASVATAAETVTESESDSSFFEESDESEQGIEGDPLASMVRDAVERVTDGDGSN
ncbi:MAG: hypothetical protein ACR2PK_14615, partial [Acidimicrobiales bacterium]